MSTSKIRKIHCQDVSTPRLRRALLAPLAVLTAIVLPGPVLAQGTITVLPKLVVSASRVPLPADEVGSSVTVITGEQLEERQISTLSDILRDVPGVAVSRTGPVGSLTQIRIRGAEANQTLVLIDGMDLSNPATDSSFDFGNMMNSNIQSIEILRGPQSALYGSDAIGGVINIVTRRPEPGEGYSATAEVQGGSFDTIQHAYRLAYGGERFYADASFSQLWTDGVSAADADQGNGERDGYENTTARVRLGVTPLDFLQIDLIGLLINSDNDLDFGLAASGRPLDTLDTQETHQRFGQAQVTATFLDGMWEHIARVNYAEIETFFNDPTSVFTGDFDGEKFKIDYQTNIFASTPDLAGAEHILSLFAEREEERQFVAVPGAVPMAEIVNYSYAAEYRLALQGALFLSGGVRYDDSDSLFDNELTHRFTAAYLFDQTDTRLHGSYGTAAKNPTLIELFGFFPGLVANPALQTEHGEGWDVGVEQSFFDGRLVVDVTWFTNYIEDLITTVFFPTTTSVNLVGTSKIHGLELTGTAEPIPGLRLDAAYTYMETEAPGGTRLVRRPEHVASFTANYAFDIMSLPANVNLNLRYHGNQTDTAFPPFPTPSRTEVLHDYVLLNFAASLEPRDGIEIFARGENLLDQSYNDVYGFGTPGIAGYVGLRVNLSQR